MLSLKDINFQEYNLHEECLLFKCCSQSQKNISLYDLRTELFIKTVPVNSTLYIGTVLTNCVLYIETVLTNNYFLVETQGINTVLTNSDLNEETVSTNNELFIKTILVQLMLSRWLHIVKKMQMAERVPILSSFYLEIFTNLYGLYT